MNEKAMYELLVAMNQKLESIESVVNRLETTQDRTERTIMGMDAKLDVLAENVKDDTLKILERVAKRTDMLEDDVKHLAGKQGEIELDIDRLKRQ